MRGRLHGLMHHGCGCESSCGCEASCGCTGGEATSGWEGGGDCGCGCGGGHGHGHGMRHMMRGWFHRGGGCCDSGCGDGGYAGDSHGIIGGGTIGGYTPAPGGPSMMPKVGEPIGAPKDEPAKKLPPGKVELPSAKPLTSPAIEITPTAAPKVIEAEKSPY
jgi:hypothetical protein